MSAKKWKERALVAEDRLRLHADPAYLLNLLLDAQGVETGERLYSWGGKRPACILIPQWLAEQVWPDEHQPTGNNQ
jgi:hypothetical protein